jgi:hypothetical protein
MISKKAAVPPRCACVTTTVDTFFSTLGARA